MNQLINLPKYRRYLQEYVDQALERSDGTPSSIRDYLDSIHRGYFDFMKNTPQLPALVIDLAELDFVASQADYEWVLDRMAEYTLPDPGLIF